MTVDRAILFAWALVVFVSGVLMFGTSGLFAVLLGITIGILIAAVIDNEDGPGPERWA